MSYQLIQDSIREAVNQYERDEISLPVVVQRLERIVDLAQDHGHPSAPELDYVWGELEIINAVILDEGTSTKRDFQDIRRLMERFVELSSLGE